MKTKRKDAAISGARVRELRHRMSLNQTEFAARLGASQRTASDWETKGISSGSRAYTAISYLLANTQPLVLAVAMAKGGTGKTTTSLHVGAAMTRFHRRRVLLVDLDPQGSLTKSLVDPGEFEGRKTLFDVLVGGESSVELSDVIVETAHEGLHLAPGGNNLYALNTRGIEDIELPFRLRDQITPTLGFDWVVIDTPPGIGQLMHAALIAADRLLIPIRDSLTDIDEVMSTVQTFRSTQRRMNPELRLLGALLTQVSPNETHALRFVREQLTAYFAECKLTTEIALSTRFKELRAARSTIFDHAPKSRGADEYRALVEELLARWTLQLEPALRVASTSVPPPSPQTDNPAGHYA
ncbi:MAG: AAA family ATPase [Proteobacteria bacterium]|nr:AAA family ATPase [Pseudomonadota bacterium]